MSPALLVHARSDAVAPLLRRSQLTMVVMLGLVCSRAGGSCQPCADSGGGDSRGRSWHWGFRFVVFPMIITCLVRDAILPLSRPRPRHDASIRLPLAWGYGRISLTRRPNAQLPMEYHFASPAATSSAAASHQRLHFAAYHKMQRRLG